MQERVVLSTKLSARVQRCPCGKASSEEECPECRRKAALQRFSAGGDSPAIAPAAVHDALRSPGRPLEPDVRTALERGFGHDFGAVRIHSDARAAESARSIDALAYTVGQDVVFGSGAYSPSTTPGRRLLAHELAHTIQQGQGGPREAQPRLEVSPVDDPLEAEADRLAARALSGTAAGGAAAPGAAATPASPRVSRTPPPGTPPPTPPATPARIVYIDANVLDQINRGNTAAANQLKQLLSSGVEVRIGQQAYNEIVTNPAIPRNGAANKLMLEELGIKIGPKTALADRVAVHDANVTTVKSGGTVVSEPDALVAAEAKAAGGEIWSFDKAFRTNPKSVESALGVKVAPESTTIQPVQGGSWDYRVGRQSLGLKSVEITLSGEVKPITPAAGEVQGPPKQGGAGETSPPPPVRVQAEYKILSSTTGADGNLVSEVEVVLKGSLDELNKLGGGKGVPAKVVIRITHTADGALVAAEGLAGESSGLVQTLARQALATVPEATGAAEGAATGALAAGAKAVPKWVKGVGWGGTILFVAVTGYQFATASSEERPRVAATAAGGFAAGTISSYLVCNLIFGIETVGLSLVGCGLVAGGIGGYAGGALTGQAYDAALESLLTPLERSLKDLQKASGNAQKLFQAMVSKSGGAGLAINESFVRQFLAVVPADLKDTELATLVAGLSPVGSGDTLTGVLNKLHSAIMSLPGRQPVVTLQAFPFGGPLEKGPLFPLIPLGTNGIRLFPQPALTPGFDPLPGGSLPTPGLGPTIQQPALEFRFDFSNLKPPGGR